MTNNIKTFKELKKLFKDTKWETIKFTKDELTSQFKEHMVEHDFIQPDTALGEFYLNKHRLDQRIDKKTQSDVYRLRLLAIKDRYNSLHRNKPKAVENSKSFTVYEVVGSNQRWSKFVPTETKFWVDNYTDQLLYVDYKRDDVWFNNLFRNKIDNSGVEFLQKSKGVKQVQNYIPTKSNLSNLSSLKAMIQHDKTIEEAYFYNEDKSLVKKCKLLNGDKDSIIKLHYDYNREDFLIPFEEKKDNIFNFFSIINKCLTPDEPKVDFFIIISVNKSLFSSNSNFVYWGIERKLPGVNTSQSGRPTDKIARKQDLLPQNSQKPTAQNSQNPTTQNSQNSQNSTTQNSPKQRSSNSKSPNLRIKKKQ